VFAILAISAVIGQGVLSNPADSLGIHRSHLGSGPSEGILASGGKNKAPELAPRGFVASSGIRLT